jgi:hypothetical protein
MVPSIVFWLCLFMAAGLFGAVVLVPKLLVAERLTVRHRELEQQLDWMQRRVDYLGQVAEAFENDPEFAAEVARVDLGAIRPDERRLPAEPVLAFRAPQPVSILPRARPRWTALLEPLAADQTVRDAALFTAAGLLIAGFAFFPARDDHEG